MEEHSQQLTHITFGEVMETSRHHMHMKYKHENIMNHECNMSGHEVMHPHIYKQAKCSQITTMQAHVSAQCSDITSCMLHAIDILHTLTQFFPSILARLVHMFFESCSRGRCTYILCIALQPWIVASRTVLVALCGALDAVGFCGRGQSHK